MKSRHLHRCNLKFPRTMAEAFKDASYANAVERPSPRPLSRWVWVALALVVFYLIGRVG